MLVRVSSQNQSEEITPKRFAIGTLHLCMANRSVTSGIDAVKCNSLKVNVGTSQASFSRLL